jgi:catechol 2,3-dioxygenase-like lactoylglutathione lyase family enzyme
VSIDRIDHLYVGVVDFPAALAWWRSLGFAVVAEWGTDEHPAARLAAGSAAVVLARTAEPVVTVHFGGTDLEALGAPVSDTHWGTRWAHLPAPDGAVFVAEDTGPTR